MRSLCQKYTKSNQKATIQLNDKNNTRMTTFIKLKLKKSDGQTKIYKQILQNIIGIIKID